MRFCMGQNAGYFKKANQRYSFFKFRFLKKINASKVDKHVMLSYLLLFNKRLEVDFFLISIQNSHVQGAKHTRWKFAAFAYYYREKPNLKSLS